MADHFAFLAGPRIASLLRLSTAKHVYSAAAADNTQPADQRKRDVQPYKDISRFISDDRIMRSVIDPGLIPLVKAMSKDVQGCRLLTTRKVAPKDSDRGAIAHVAGYGIRILVYFDDVAVETVVVWECQYAVA